MTISYVRHLLAQIDAGDPQACRILTNDAYHYAHELLCALARETTLRHQAEARAEAAERRAACRDAGRVRP